MACWIWSVQNLGTIHDDLIGFSFVFFWFFSVLFFSVLAFVGLLLVLWQHGGHERINPSSSAISTVRSGAVHAPLSSTCSRSLWTPAIRFPVPVRSCPAAWQLLLSSKLQVAQSYSSRCPCLCVCSLDDSWVRSPSCSPPFPRLLIQFSSVLVCFWFKCKSIQSSSSRSFLVNRADRC